MESVDTSRFRTFHTRYIGSCRNIYRNVEFSIYRIESKVTTCRTFHISYRKSFALHPLWHIPLFFYAWHWAKASIYQISESLTWYIGQVLCLSVQYTYRIRLSLDFRHYLKPGMYDSGCKYKDRMLLVLMWKRFLYLRPVLIFAPKVVRSPKTTFYEFTPPNERRAPFDAVKIPWRRFLCPPPRPRLIWTTRPSDCSTNARKTNDRL